MHTPVPASWPNQVEIYFSIGQRKVVAPNDFTALTEIASQLAAFQRYKATAAPFGWRFSTADLRSWLDRLEHPEHAVSAAAA